MAGTQQPSRSSWSDIPLDLDRWPGPPPPVRARGPRPLRRRVPPVARRRAGGPAAPAAAAARAPGRHRVQPPWQRAAPLPRLRGLRRCLRQLAGILGRGRLLPEVPFLRRHRDASPAVPRPERRLLEGHGGRPRATDYAQAGVLLPATHRHIHQVSEERSGCGVQARGRLLVVGAYGSFSLSADMAFHKGKLYALVLDIFGDSLYTIDVSVDQRTGDPWISQVRRTISSVACPLTMGMGENKVMKTLYLVESEAHNALLMVRKRMYGRGGGARAHFLNVCPKRANRVGGVHGRLAAVQGHQGDDHRRQPGAVPADCIVFLNNDEEDHEVEGLGFLQRLYHERRLGLRLCSNGVLAAWLRACNVALASVMK